MRVFHVLSGVLVDLSLMETGQVISSAPLCGRDFFKKHGRSEGHSRQSTVSCLVAGFFYFSVFTPVGVVRVEIYIPDLPAYEYQDFLRSFEVEFTYVFGGSSVVRGIVGCYLSEDGGLIEDRIFWVTNF